MQAHIFAHWPQLTFSHSHPCSLGPGCRPAAVAAAHPIVRMALVPLGHCWCLASYILLENSINALAVAVERVVNDSLPPALLIHTVSGSILSHLGHL